MGFATQIPGMKQGHTGRNVLVGLVVLVVLTVLLPVVITTYRPIRGC